MPGRGPLRAGEPLAGERPPRLFVQIDALLRSSAGQHGAFLRPPSHSRRYFTHHRRVATQVLSKRLTLFGFHPFSPFVSEDPSRTPGDTGPHASSGSPGL